MVNRRRSARGILAGTEGRDPGQGFPVEHLEALPLGSKLPAPLVKCGLSLGELATEEANLILEVRDQDVGGRWVGRS